LATFIPEETVTDIRNATNIVDVISEAVLLKKRGKDYVGLCPFHSEKTPSFTVSPAKQIFHCFGCATGGNVFSFLMKHEALTFPEAARRLAGQAGIDIPVQAMSPEQRKHAGERDLLFEINQMAMDQFHRALMHPDRGGRAMAYLGERGITQETVETFNLGYAPDGWENLATFLARKGVPRSAVEKSGLVLPRRGGTGYYDRFRERIMFPICDGNRRVMGFGGRALGDGQPKYLNSPETPLYHKGRSLYGLPNARAACRESGTAYIVEGYFDFLSLYQNNIRNVVATLGTALTPEHIRILKGHAGKLVLVYDSDEAGVKAALRSIDLFMAEGVDARIIILPSGYDPDAYVMEFGSQAFLDAGSEASGVISFLVDSAIEKHGLSVQGKLRIIEEMESPLSAIGDPIARSLYVKNLAETLGIDESAILERIRERTGRDITRKRQGPRTEHGGMQDARNTRMSTGSQEGAQGRGGRFERQIIAMMLQFPEILSEVEDRSVLDGFQDGMLRAIGHAILTHFPKADNEVSALIGHIDDNQQRNIIIQLSIGDSPWDHEGCLKLIRQFELSRSRKENSLLEEIRAAEARHDYDLLARLLKDKQLQVSKHIG